MIRTLALLAALTVAAATPIPRLARQGDLVTHLPGVQKMPNFRVFSGFLDVPESSKHLHYFFTESQRDPINDPLVLWLNGGPGCSSMEGALYENGFFSMQHDGSLTVNEYSWNKFANVLYLEAPAGVGFSYATNAKDLHNDDMGTADDSYHALQEFFKRHPEYQGRPFYVTGESYGGVYVPTLSARIVQGNKANEGVHINLKAAAIGNGITDFNENDDTAVEFAYFHGLFGDDLWLQLTENCCSSGKCDFHTGSNKKCAAAIQQAMGDIYTSGINYYGIYNDCASGKSLSRHSNAMKLLFRNIDGAHDAAVGANVPCIDSNGATEYLNRAEVKKALHIPSIASQPWSVCSDILKYNVTLETTRDVILGLLQDNIRVFYYNGDTDLACNFLGDERFVDQLQQPVTAARRSWHVNGQIAGFVKEFKGITFATVRGAGHMVPQDKPAEALVMFRKFLENESL